MDNRKVEISSNKDTNQATTKGVLWSMFERFSTMGIQLLCTLVIAQFLTPDQFGLVGMISVFLSFSVVMAEGGFGQAIIREKEVTIRDINSIFFFNIFVGFTIYFSFYLAAPLIADFYNQQELTLLIRVSFIALIINAFTIVQEALLYKDVNFAKVSKVSIISVVISGILGVITAFFLRNVWALIVQSISNGLIRSVIYWVMGKWKPDLDFSWKSITKYLSFSLNLLFSRMVASLAENAANLFIGKGYSAAVLGNYTVPDKLQKAIAGTISFSIHRVSYPIMATFQDDIVKLRDYSQKIVGMAFFIISPIMFYLLIASKQIFSILLSEAWTESAVYFQYMCIIGAVFCFSDINMDILIVRGRSKKVLIIEIVRKAIFIISLLIGISYNIYGLLLVLVIYNIFNAVLVNYYAGLEINCSLWKQFINISPTLLSLLLSVMSIYYIDRFVHNAYIFIIISAIVFSLTYIGSAYIMRNSNIRIVMNFIMNLKNK